MKYPVQIAVFTLVMVGLFNMPALVNSTRKNSITASHNPSKNTDSEEPAHKWMSIETALDSMKIKPRKIFVEIYTDWCGVCKMLDKKTLSKPRITKMLDEYYYSVKLNAEKADPILFKDSLYTFNPNLGRGMHSLALYLGKDAGTVSYPTMVILDENLEVVYRYPSFINVMNLEEVLDMYR